MNFSWIFTACWGVLNIQFATILTRTLKSLFKGWLTPDLSVPQTWECVQINWTTFVELQRPRFAIFTAVQFWHRKMARNQKGTNRLQLCAHLKGLYTWADVLKKQWKCCTHSIFCHCIIFMDLYMSQGSQDSKRHGSSQLRTKKFESNKRLC